MKKCDRCGTMDARLYCSGCALQGHQDYPGECSSDTSAIGDVCSECWAVLSHVDHVISCEGGCGCEADYHCSIEWARQEIKAAAAALGRRGGRAGSREAKQAAGRLGGKAGLGGKKPRKP